MRVLAVDPTVQVAFFGILTTIITTVGLVVVGIINNKKERITSAEGTMEGVLRERVMLRDEQISDLKSDIANRDHLIEELQEELQLYKDGRLP